MTSKESPLLNLDGCHKKAVMGERTIEILRNVSFFVNRGESVAIVGPSGSGKSTLLHCIGLLTPIDDGVLTIDGVTLGSDRLVIQKMRGQFAYIFQDGKLIPGLTALVNVQAPLAHRGIAPGRQKELAKEALSSVNMSDRLHHNPSRLSGGEQMRVAIARALVVRPKILLADEPTGSLDSVTGEKIADLLFNTVTKNNALVMVTHYLPLAQRADRIVTLRDGEVVVE